MACVLASSLSAYLSASEYKESWLMLWLSIDKSVRPTSATDSASELYEEGRAGLEQEIRALRRWHNSGVLRRNYPVRGPRWLEQRTQQLQSYALYPS